MKNKFFYKNTNKNSNNNIKKIIILILLSITLYFSFSKFNFKENFNINYRNLCKNKPTKFYSSINPNASILINEADYGTFPQNTNSCEYKCNNTPNCDLYIYNGPDPSDSSCNLYSLVSGNTIYVNCDDKQIPQNDIKGTYLGEGLVKTNYYNENISDFSYHNFLLDQAISIKNNYNSFDVNNNYENNINLLTNIIYPYFDKIKNHNNISNDELYTYLNYHPDSSLNLQGTDMNKININNNFLKLNKNKNNNEAQKINNNFDFNKNSFIYTILAILLIISIILVVLYKLFPNYLNEFTLLIYFISIIFIVFFIHILI